MKHSVKEIRRYTGMTQAEFASEIGVSVIQIKRYEKMGTLPKNEAVLRNLVALVPPGGIPKSLERRAGLTAPLRDSWKAMPWSQAAQIVDAQTAGAQTGSEELAQSQNSGPVPDVQAPRKLTRAERKEKWLWEGYKARYISKQQYILLGGIYFSETASPSESSPKL
jgi:transcriptional regulator with XRE-family HTH domain